MTVNLPHFTTAGERRDRRDEARDIGPPPKCQHPAERAEAEQNLAVWLKRYFPLVFYMDFAPHHIAAIRRLEYSLDNAGYFAFAMPRGDGKTVLVECGTTFGILSGKHDYIYLIGATQGKADELLKDIKYMLYQTPLLLQDYPEWVHAIKATENNAQRANNLRYNGEPLEIDWKKNQVVIPNLTTGSVAIIQSCGIEGAVRGAHYVTPTGAVRRPSLAIPDDPETAKSAKSQSQIDFRLGVLRADVAKLCGPDQEMSIFVPCTIMRTGAVADVLLNQDPNWHGQCTKSLDSMPENMDIWEDYNKARIAGENDMDKGLAANAFYLANRDELERGASVTWAGRIKGTALTALQSTMNEYFKNGVESFWAECQNEPLDQHVSVYEITPELVRTSLSGVARQRVPANCDIITGYIDINYTGLHYAVVAWRNDECGYVIDHGKEPRGAAVLFDPKNPAGKTEGQAIFEGLHKLCQRLCLETTWAGGSGDNRIEMLGIDAGAKWYETVFNFAAHATYGKTQITAGVGRAAKKYRLTGSIGRPGDNVHKTKWRKGRVILHNSDYWRMATQKAFLLDNNSPGSLNLYGTEPHVHDYLAHHACNEKLVDYHHGPEFDYYTWFLKPGEDNDMLDALVGAKALSSLCGISSVAKPKEKRKPNRPRTVATIGV